MKNATDTSIQYLKGVGPSRKKMFERLGVETVEDLMYLFPRRYEDRRSMTPLDSLKPGEWQTVCGRVTTRSGRKTWHTRKHVFESVISDDKGRLTAVWFNQPYMEHYFRSGARVVLYGRVDLYRDRLQMIAPEYEIIEDDDKENLSTGRIVPVYPLTRGMSQRYLRRSIRMALHRYAGKLVDPVPFHLREKYSLKNLTRALNSIHFPETFEDRQESYRRVAFEEFLLFQISILLRRLSIVHRPGYVHTVGPGLVRGFENAFDFELTGAQKRVIREIGADMRKAHPMHRLLQGDVGSGKTLVALFGCVAAVQSGYQAAIMAPTEILARQHYENIRGILKGFEQKSLPSGQTILRDFGPDVALLVGSASRKEKTAVTAGIREGSVNLIIGTHALIQEDLAFKNLSFVVIDEQHKFGVRQRALLTDKGVNPDVLIMTATPIPRTLSLTLFGDLDISTLDEMPAGRGKVTTKLFAEDDAKEAYTEAAELVKQGQQVFVVYPVIEESEKLDLKAAERMYEELQKGPLKGLRLGLVHGRMKQDRVSSVMEAFRNRDLDILVATTILEVGVDVPNANCMVIEHADRFGLSQLHQLRGRVGRGASDARCLLIASPATAEAGARLDAVLSTVDGFKIAEQDLMIRGPGEFFGRHQHGLNELRIADPVTQLDILETARREAAGLVEDDPYLERPANRTVKAFIQRRYPTYLAMVKGG